MEASPPVFYYTYRGSLPHPGVGEGDAVVLQAGGTEEVEAFALGALGVAALVIDDAAVVLREGQDVSVSWTAASNGDASEIHIYLNIAQHGGTPGWIDFVVPDTGSASIPAALSDALLGRGASGFPSLTLTRRSADSIDTTLGCIDFAVKAEATFDVDIDGLTSCSSNDDCTAPTTC